MGFGSRLIFVFLVEFRWLWVLREFLFLMSESKKIKAKIQIFYQICMNFQHFGMKFACKGVAVLIFEA